MKALDKAVRIFGLCAIALAFAAPPALAQGSGKFERAQPAAPQGPATPAAPVPADPVIRELMRKAQARESEAGLCGRLTDKDGGADFNLFPRRPAGSTHQFSRHNGFIGRVTCGLYRIAAAFSTKGKRCILQEEWICYAGQTCSAARVTMCEISPGEGRYVTVKPGQR